MKDAIAWFEIPVCDFDRALKFYNYIFQSNMEIQNFGEIIMAFFQIEKGGVGGALVQHEWYEPSKKGVLIYLNAEPDLENVLSRVEKAGGKVIIQKKQISPEVGHMGVFEDTEGNRIALHSLK